ncbi:MAG: glutamine--fructose-6-phosphate aminotransferase, partial [Clostridia bacterium]|nr:glutamine--fructose-6-phosphate aminotransferase [Clostridia bacterium]
MCGIVGYVGKSLRAGDVLGVLKKLEYRGYDSAGISITGAGEQRVYKALGVIDNLCAKVPKKLFASSAIA